MSCSDLDSYNIQNMLRVLADIRQIQDFADWVDAVEQIGVKMSDVLQN